MDRIGGTAFDHLVAEAMRARVALRRARSLLDGRFALVLNCHFFLHARKVA